MSSGHGADKPDKANHPGRQVHRERFNATFSGPQGFGGVDPAYEADHDYTDEMETRSRLEDEYGGGAGDWDH